MLVKLFISLVLIAGQAFASPWNVELGEWRNYTTYRYYTTDEYFNVDGDKRAQGSEFSKNEVQFMAEYGIAPKWNIGFNVFASKQTDSNADVLNYDLQGISRSDLFARRELYRDNDYAIAAQTSISLPSYYPNKSANVAILYEKAAAEAALFAGVNFAKWQQNHWVASKIAYRHRTGAFDDQFLLGAQLGLRANAKLAIIPEINITQSAQKIAQPLASVAGDNNYNLTSAQLSVAYDFTDALALQIGVFQHVAGANAGAGGGGLCSLWLAL